MREGMCEQTRNVLGFTALLVNTCLQRWALGVSATGFSGTRRNRPLWKCKVAVGGAAEAGLSQKFSEETIPLSGSVTCSVRISDFRGNLAFLLPRALVPTAGVVVGNRGETLSREQSVGEGRGAGEQLD